MREQSTPFRVILQQPSTQRNRFDSINNASNDNYITQFDYSLDLTKYRDSLGELFSAENRGRLFELSSNNLLLSFLLSVCFFSLYNLSLFSLRFK
jgi:Golgi nucleoside diphosphatase